MKEIKYIDLSTEKVKTPEINQPKSSWRQEMVKTSLRTLQHVSPGKTAEIIWHYFTQPGKPRFSPAQKAFVEKAIKSIDTYNGQQVQKYSWGDSGPKILVSHGWRSKAVDFRRMVESLVQNGYQVDGIDMIAHGHSAGRHTALPEFFEIIKNHYLKNGPYQAIIGHSLGGLAAGMAISAMSETFQPKQLFMLASPPYARYFFKDIVDDLGFRKQVYTAFCQLVEKNYGRPIDFFDIRNKSTELANVEIHLLYDENDDTVPIDKGLEIPKHLDIKQFVQTKGLGHYKIMAHEAINQYIVDQLKSTQSY